MFSLFRLLRVAVSARRAPRQHPLAVSQIALRVGLGDLDINRHMNNARYLKLMDLGRTDLFIRTGIGRLVFQARWMPVVAAVTVRYRRSLLPFQRFTLRTRILGWDAKSLFFEHVIVRDGRVVTIALARCVVRRSGGWVPPAELIERVTGSPVQSPPMPDWALAWAQAEAGVRPEEELQYLAAS